MDFRQQTDMARPYSYHLREKLVSAYEAGNIGLEKMAARFQVSRAWAERIWKAKRETGTTEWPAAKPRGFPTRLTPEIRLRLAAQIGQKPDATLTTAILLKSNDHVHAARGVAAPSPRGSRPQVTCVPSRYFRIKRIGRWSLTV